MTKIELKAFRKILEQCQAELAIGNREALAIEASPDEMEGSFGICVDCEQAISPRRLAVVPWAATCIVCQEAAEREKETSGNAIDTRLEEAA